MKCQEVCQGFESIGEEACLGCAGMSSLEIATRDTIKRITKGLRADGRCMHGMLPGQCSYCAGMKLTGERRTRGTNDARGYISHVGLAFMELRHITYEEVQ